MNLTTNPRIRRRYQTFLGLICLAVLGIILTLGLWPFHAPRNGVSWLRDRNGLRFGKYGTAISSGMLTIPNAQSEACGSLELLLQISEMWDRRTVLTFYAPANQFQFSVRQSQIDLALQTTVAAGTFRTKTAGFRVPDVFRQRGPIFITVTSCGQGTTVYIDGVPAKQAPQFQLSAQSLAGRLILGDSPDRVDSWRGHVLRLAIYHSELTPERVFAHYHAWTQNARPEIAADEHTIALYLFDERAGSVVHNKVTGGVDLYIPEKYAVLDQVFLDPPWKEFSWSTSYFNAILKNIVGFTPLGFCFYAFLLMVRGVKRPAFATVVLGTLVSLTIEILQAYLPTRESGTTDLFTNTLGTYMGVLLYRAASPIVAATLPWLVDSSD